MITSIDIAKLIAESKRKKKAKSGIDSALMNLGVGLKLNTTSN